MARGECCGCTRRCSWRKHWLLLVVCLEYALQKVHTASSRCVARAAPRDSSPGVRDSSPGVRACVPACSRARVATGAAAGASQGHTPSPRPQAPLAWRRFARLGARWRRLGRDQWGPNARGAHERTARRRLGACAGARGPPRPREIAIAVAGGIAIVVCGARAAARAARGGARRPGGVRC